MDRNSASIVLATVKKHSTYLPRPEFVQHRLEQRPTLSFSSPRWHDREIQNLSLRRCLPPDDETACFPLLFADQLHNPAPPQQLLKTPLAPSRPFPSSPLYLTPPSASRS